MDLGLELGVDIVFGGFQNNRVSSFWVLRAAFLASIFKYYLFTIVFNQVVKIGYLGVGV